MRDYIVVTIGELSPNNSSEMSHWCGSITLSHINQKAEIQPQLWQNVAISDKETDQALDPA